VLSGLARGFGVFDHWFCEVPSQTFTNRSFWTAATALGFVVNEPVPSWLAGNTAETIFNRLEQHGKTWKVYVAEPDRFSATGLIHYPRLKDRFATHFVPFAQFEADAAAGGLPDFSYIEPCLVLGHGDSHPAVSRVLGHGIVLPGVDPPSSILGGEEFLARIYNAYKGMQSPAGLPGPGHRDLPVGSRRRGVQPGAPARLPDRHPAGAVGTRRPAHRPRRRRPDLFPRLHPRHPARPRHLAGGGLAPGTPVHPGCARPWPDPVHPGQVRFNGIRAYAEQHNIQIDGLPADPEAEIPPEQALHIIHNFLAIQFPLLHPAVPSPAAAT
jgi:hypothetical protein